MRTRLTGSGTSAYTYTSENRLATGPGGAALAYDSTGRLSQVYTPALSTNFDYDGAALIGERDAVSYGLLRRYVHGPGEDQPLVWYEGAGLTDKRYLMTDERGSVVAVTTAAGAATAINSYDEYGIPASTNVGRFGYTGQTWIPEIGLNYYKARMYSPTLGRFMQTDPIGYKDGVNWYDYVDGDPVNRVDPDGQDGMVITGIYTWTMEFAAQEVQNGIEDPLGEAIDIAMVVVDIADFPSGESVIAAGVRRSLKAGIKEGSERAVSGTGRRAGDVRRATAKGVKDGPPKIGPKVKKSDGSSEAMRGGGKGGVAGSKTQGKKFGKGPGETSGRQDSGHRGGPPHNHPPSNKGTGHWWWPFR